MADAFELIAQLREQAAENETLLPIVTTLETEVRSYADRLDGATVQLAEKETGIAQYQAEVSRLKSQNYDLVIAAGGSKSEPPSTEPQRPGGIAGLFNSRKK